MAEIKIEKKKSVLPWAILALVLIAGIIYLYYSLTTVRDDKVADNTNNTELTDPHGNNTTVTSFVSYVNDDTNKMSLDHNYTNNALLKLTDAIEAKASDIGYDVKVDLNGAKEYADKITNDPFETTHANNIRKAADILSTSLANMQQAKYPALAAEAGELKNASASINPDVLTLDQKNAVKSFFSKAANLLSKMN
jgi:hypothetical protein